MLSGNNKIVQKINPNLLEKLKARSSKYVKKTEAKNGSPTLCVTYNEKEQFLHSSYNPEREAEAIAENFSFKEGTPLIFVGAGLGYHIPLILKKVNPRYFYILEIHPDILKETLSTIDLRDSEYKSLSNIFISQSEDEVKQSIRTILEESPVPPNVVVLPSYERTYPNSIDCIYQEYQEQITKMHDQVASDFSFQRLWGLNSLRNFSYILNTPNVFRDMDPKYFEGKPAIIVGAGPSLTYEIENLQKIQEEQSAYIFAVGSAINALIEYGIRPHAVIAYDPKKESKRVFEKMNKLNIKNIPLMFGSTIGTEALRTYPGEKIHFVMSQDHLSPYLTGSESKQLNIINDGPTVTVIALQLLSHLRCDPIILVGQNLAFEKNRRYAQGIQYQKGTSGGSVAPTKEFRVESVYGEELSSSKEFVLSKESIEAFLSNRPELNVINCTKGGAKILHTKYANLDSLLGFFTLNTVPAELLWVDDNSYERKEVISRASSILCQFGMFVSKLEEIAGLLKDISICNLHNATKINKLFSKLDNTIHEIRALEYFKTLIEPMTRSYFEKAAKEIQYIRKNGKTHAKTSEIVLIFNNLITIWNQIHDELSEPIKTLNNI